MARKAKSRGSTGRRPPKKSVTSRSKIKTKSTRQREKERERDRQRREKAARDALRQIEAERRADRLKKRALPVHKKIARRTKTTRGKSAVLQQLGLYKPKKGRGKRITPGKKKYIDKLAEKFADYLSPNYLFVKPKGKKKTRDAQLRKARQAGEETTRTGIMVKRQGDVRSARIVKDKQTGFHIATRRTMRDRKGRQHVETIITPLAAADELEMKKEKMRRAFKRSAAGTKGKKDTFVRFYVEGKFGSHRTFGADEFDLLWEELLKYTNADKPGQQLGFINRIKFGIVAPGAQRNKVLSQAERDYIEAQRATLEAMAEDGDEDAIEELEAIEASEEERRRRERSNTRRREKRDDRKRRQADFKKAREAKD
jgi:hypothetical protein